MRLYILISVLSASVLSKETKNVESRLVLINSGLVQGYKDPQEDVFAFYGIPYAKVPTGKERFKGPLPPPTWMHKFDAVDRGVICPQNRVLGLISESLIIKEDCLIANVYVPVTEKIDLPVVVYVHGGGFFFGYGNHYPPKQLVSSQNVIAVTFNYRLGAHGFLCLGTEDVPGNAGMKDKVALLRWVKKNIANFGGNPDDVTIAGFSAGSASVDLLMISKMAQGLFNKVIPESGTSTSPFSIQIDPIQNAKEYAKMIDIDVTDDLVQLENSFKNVSLEVLLSGNAMNRKDSTLLVSPCVEKDNGQEMFLEDNPVNILKRGEFPVLPILHGFANMEGLVRVRLFDVWKKDMNENFAKFLPVDLNFKGQEDKALTSKKIKSFYFGDKQVDHTTVLQYVNYMTDVLFGCPTLRAVDYLVKAGHNKVFLYEYSYTDEYTAIVPYTDVRGADHCDQTFAVLDGLPPSMSNLSDDFINMKSLIRELWGNFIKTGEPSASGVPIWKPTGINGSPHMALKKDPEVRGPLLKERCHFWNEIYNSKYKFPVPPIASRHTEL